MIRPAKEKPGVVSPGFSLKLKQILLSFYFDSFEGLRINLRTMANVVNNIQEEKLKCISVLKHCMHNSFQLLIGY